MWTRLRYAMANSSSAEWADGRYFAIALAAAFGLHLMGLLLWHLMPPMQVEQIPVRVIDVKLGGNETPVPSTAAGNSHAVENALSEMSGKGKPAREKKAEPAPVAKAAAHETKEKPAAHVSHSREKVVGKFDVRNEKSSVAAPVVPVEAHQFVRELSSPAAAAAKPAAPQSAATIALNYERAISHWIQKFKVYPEKARTAGMQGETVVRIRIDRQGNIGYYILEHSTGYPLLDQAAIDMIKHANPVPPVPAGYKGDMFEFLIPVSFHLQ